ncbi:hypothetical protein NMG60_11031153 [Bertholletia excelsa]
MQQNCEAATANPSSSDRLGKLISHLCASPRPPIRSLRRQLSMASEKEAARAAVPSDAPTILFKTSCIGHKLGGDDFLSWSSWFYRVLKWFHASLHEHNFPTEIPAKVVYEDEKVLAFRDISPQAPTHILIIPKVKDGLTGLSKAEERHTEILGHLLYTAKLVAKQEGLDDGFRVVINDGPNGCQSVHHIHVHLLGGRQMNWPPG